MKPVRDLVVDALVLLVYLVAANPAITGLLIHEWVSLGVLLVVLVHSVLHWEWTLDTFKRFFTKLSVASRSNLIVDAVLFSALMVCMLSGIMVSRHVLIAFGFFAPGYFVWNPMHSISATLLLAAVLVHLAMHWKWIAMAVRSRVVELTK